MAENTKIQWAHHTFNPWRGCAEVSPACDNCYARTMAKRNPEVLGKWGENMGGGTRVIASEGQWKMLKGWDSTALAMGERHRVFVASLADIMEDWHGKIMDSKGNVVIYRDPRGGDRDRPMVMTDIRYRFFEEASCRQNLDFLLLTKRPESYDFWLRVQRSDRPNLWVGTTVENQDYIWRAYQIREIPK